MARFNAGNVARNILLDTVDSEIRKAYVPHVCMAAIFDPWNTADMWPDWTGVDTCECGMPLDDMPDDSEHCPSCGMYLRDMVMPHCDTCDKPVYGTVYTCMDDSTDYCPGCFDSIVRSEARAIRAYRKYQREQSQYHAGQ